MIPEVSVEAIVAVQAFTILLLALTVAMMGGRITRLRKSIEQSPLVGTYTVRLGDASQTWSNVPPGWTPGNVVDNPSLRYDDGTPLFAHADGDRHTHEDGRECMFESGEWVYMGDSDPDAPTRDPHVACERAHP